MTRDDTAELQRAIAFLRARFRRQPPPRLAIVLGSGLGGVAATLEGAVTIDASEVPGLPRPRVAGHAGRFHAGSWGKAAVLLIEGRSHLYEGYPVEDVTRTVRAAAALGARQLILTNAAGSCDRDLPPGSLLRAVDLLDLFFRRLRGREDPGLRGPGGAIDRARGGPLDPALGGALDRAALAERIVLRRGVLCGGLGPSYETAAEVRLLRRLGASAVTMSTIPEAIAARRAGMAVATVSLLTNYATGITAPGRRTEVERLAHEEVLASGADASARLARLLRRAALLLLEPPSA